MALTIEEFETAMKTLGVDMSEHGSKSKAAELLGVTPQTLYKAYRDGYVTGHLQKSVHQLVKEKTRSNSLKVELGEALEALKKSQDSLEEITSRMNRLYLLDRALHRRATSPNASLLDDDGTEEEGNAQ